MDLRPLSEDVMVAPQLEPSDMPALAERGVRLVICNRPDAEVPPELRAATMQEAAEAAGLAFTFNPLAPGQLTLEAIEEQQDALDGADGPAVAYCASGTRSAILWALAQAGRMPSDEIVAAAERAGYAIGNLRGQIDALAAERGA
jgi:uncharacterized protein (TIGR01244 family)